MFVSSLSWHVCAMEAEFRSWPAGCVFLKNDGFLSKCSFDTILWAVFNFMATHGRRGHRRAHLDKKPKVILSDCDELIC